MEPSIPSWKVVGEIRAATLATSGLAADDVSAYRQVILESDLPFPPNYRGGQLVVEYATVGFRSREDCGPYSTNGIAKMNPKAA